MGPDLADRADGVTYAGPSIQLVEGLFVWTDSSVFGWAPGNRPKDRIRKRTIKRAVAPDLHRLLDGQVDVKTMLTVMKREEAFGRPCVCRVHVGRLTLVATGIRCRH